MTFGEKLRMLRTAQGLTQDELARKIYVTRTAVSKWEADRGFPNIDSLKLLASVFGVGLDELLSYGEAEAARQAEARRASVLYAAAMVFLALTVLFALLAYCLRQRYFLIGSVGYGRLPHLRAGHAFLQARGRRAPRAHRRGPVGHCGRSGRRDGRHGYRTQRDCRPLRPRLDPVAALAVSAGCLRVRRI